MAPFYHRLLIHLDRVIVVDLDLEFRFDSENGFKTVRIVLRFLEQGWSYRAATSLLQTWQRTNHGFRPRPIPVLSFYHIWLGTSAPGKGHFVESFFKSQGVNAGLMLFQLDKMRESEEYNLELAPSSMSGLSEMFLPRPEWSLAAQDWFSLAHRFTI